MRWSKTRPFEHKRFKEERRPVRRRRRKGGKGEEEREEVEEAEEGESWVRLRRQSLIPFPFKEGHLRIIKVISFLSHVHVIIFFVSTL